jgi:3-phosphoshikimate 1-carboxyvinyltransferase
MAGERARYNPRVSSASAEDRVRGLRPGSAVRGAVALPCSKSIAQRALVCAALAGGTTRITALTPSGDVDAARALCAACADVKTLAPAAVAVTGRPPGPHRGWSPERALDAGESGTLARLATAAIALCARAGRPIELRARGTLAKRTSRALFASLKAAGVAIEPLGALHDGWPARIVPIGPPSRMSIENPASSQEISALLVALSAYPDALTLDVGGAIPSRPYLDMTIASLRRFGVRIDSGRDGALESFFVKGPLVVPENPLAIEPDASAAAVALAAACLSEGEVTVPGLTRESLQGDVRIVDHLRAFGCDARADEHALSARGAPRHGADVDLEREPDLAPVVACVAARAALDGRGASRLTGLHTLPGKESSRIEVLATGLRAVGLEAVASVDTLTIALRNAPPARVDVELDPHADHRMAFAFALLGLCVEGVRVSDPQCVAKSWPGFWSALRAAGARSIEA